MNRDVERSPNAMRGLAQIQRWLSRPDREQLNRRTSQAARKRTASRPANFTSSKSSAVRAPSARERAADPTRAFQPIRPLTEKIASPLVLGSFNLQHLGVMLSSTRAAGNQLKRNAFTNQFRRSGLKCEQKHIVKPSLVTVLVDLERSDL
jgi:hypothetical protein